MCYLKRYIIYLCEIELGEALTEARVHLTSTNTAQAPPRCLDLNLRDNKCSDDTQSTHVISRITALRAGILVSGATRAGVGVEDGPAEMQSWHTAVTEADAYPPFQHLSQKTCLACSAIEALEWTNQRTLGVQRQERWHLVESIRNGFIMHGWDLAEFWSPGKTSPGRSGQGRDCQVNGEGGVKAQRVAWIAGSWGLGPGWWHLELGGQGGITCLLHPCVLNTALSFLLCHLKCHSPETFLSVLFSHCLCLGIFCFLCCMEHFSSSCRIQLQCQLLFAAFLSLAWSVQMLWPCLWKPTLGSWQYCSPPTGRLF